MFYIDLVWNREFNWVRWQHTFTTLDSAIAYAKHLESWGDGASVKKTRIVDEDGKIVYQHGKKVT